MEEDEVKNIILQIFQGLLHIGFLPLNLYLFTANKLLNATYTGYGYTLTELYEKGADMKTLRNLATNIYHFSAAKTFQQVYDIQSIIFDDKGFKIPYSEFEKKAGQIFEHYNKNWLEVEYNAASMSANAASQWEGFMSTADQFPLLKYQTAGDGRVRPLHAQMDGVVRPINDGFWNYYFPPNGWNCRCDVIQLALGEAEKTILSPDDRKIIKESVPEIFRNNPAKSGKIFTEHHPYFEVEAKYETLKKNNFNLPIPI